MVEVWVEQTLLKLQESEGRFLFAKQVTGFSFAAIVASAATLAFLVVHSPDWASFYFTISSFCLLVGVLIFPFSVFLKKQAWDSRNRYRKRFFAAGYRVEDDWSVVTNDLHAEVVFKLEGSLKWPHTTHFRRKKAA